MKAPIRATCAWLLALVAQVSSSALGTPVAEAATLRPTFGGVLLEARLMPSGSDSLTGAWADAGHARLMRCAPRCTVVKEIPLSGPLSISQNSTYRVVVGGTFKPGKRVKVLLRFGQSTVVTVDATVVAR